MLTDQLFGESETPLTDKLFAEKPKGLTDQLTEQERGELEEITTTLRAESLREKDIGKGTIQGAFMKEFLAPSVEEFDSFTTEPVLRSVGKTLKSAAKAAGMELLAASELAMSLASGMLLYLPSKLYGLMALPFGREVANVAEEEMAKLGYHPHTEKGKAAAKLVGKGFETFLSPAHKLDEVISGLSPEAGYLVGFGAELAEFALTGGMVKGAKARFKPTIEQARRIIDAKRKMEIDRINELKKQAENIPNEAIKRAQQKILEVEKIQAEIDAKEAMENLDYGEMIKEDLQVKGRRIKKIKQPKKYIADEAINKAMERIKVEKKKPPKPKPLDEEAIEDLATINAIEKHYGRKIDEISDKEIEDWFAEQYTTEDYVFGVSDRRFDVPMPTRIRSIISTLKDELPSLFKTNPKIRVIKSEEFMTRTKEGYESWRGLYDSETNTIFIPEDVATSDLIHELVHSLQKNLAKKVSKSRLEDITKKIEDKISSRMEEAEAEPITDLDLQTGAREPEQLSTENSPFREKDPEVTAQQRKLFEEKKIGDSPEVMVSKWLNDVNSWLDGKEVDIEKVRDNLSTLAIATKDPANRIALLDYFNGDAAAVDNFAELVSSAAEWARRAERSKAEPGVQLNMMIPVDQLPEAVRDLVLKGKEFAGRVIRAGDLYRNKTIFDKTGFWLGKDGKWRYEIDDSKAELRLPKDRRTLDGFSTTLGEILDYPELYKTVPGIDSMKVYFRDLGGDAGQYTSGGGRTLGKGYIAIDPHRSRNIKKTLFHELQHAVNDVAGSRFRGASTGVAGGYFEYLIDPGEMESRLAERRLRMTAEERKKTPPWEMLDRMLRAEMFTRDVRLGPKYGTKLYSGIPIDLAYERLKRGLSRIIDDIRRGGLEESAKQNILKGYELLDRDLHRGATWLVAHADTVLPIVERNNLDKRPLEIAARYVIENNIEIEGIDLQARARKMLNRATGKVVKLYDIGGAIGEGAKQVIELYKSAKRKGEEARGIKDFKPKRAVRELLKELTRSFVDRSGNIRKDLLDVLGEKGYGVIQRMYLSKGAGALAAAKLKQMQKEVYGGLSRNEKRILDDIIFHSRILDIAKYKTAKDFKELKKYPPEESIAYLELFGEMEGLSPERAHELYHVREDGGIGGRAGAYFEWMRNTLKDMLDAELITEQEFKDLSAHNYRRLKIVDIFDKRRPSLVKKGISVYDSGVEALAKGRESTIFERDAQVMALEVFNRAYGRILNNEANKALLEVARKYPDNPLVRVSEKYGGKGKIPSGWNRMFLYEKGERIPIYLSPDMSKEWISANPETTYRYSQFLRYISGSPVLRTFATGINWGFALANIPRDVMHLWFAARVYEDGKWKPVYSSHAPVFAAQLTRDLLVVFPDAALRRGRYKDYINEGGGMEFLVHQGRILRRGRHIEGPLDAFYKYLGYFGETSEILTRLAIRERVIRRRARERGISVEKARRDPKIAKEATFAARDYIDFGQGGGIAKALDNAIPYFNAPIQGTRGLLRAFKDNPWSSMYKLSQFAALVTGLEIAAEKFASQTMKEVTGSVDDKNNLIIPLGDRFSFVDERGQTRYPYFKIPLDPGQRFFKAFFRAAARKWLGYEVDEGEVASTLKELFPVEGTSGVLPPTLSGALGYVTNKDFWLNEDVWKKTEPFSFPRSKEEYTSRTPEAYIDIGKLTGLSPERTRYVVEELVTNGTVWSYLLGQGYDAAFGDLPKEKKEQHLAMVLSEMPIIRRFIGVTNPYMKHATKIDEAQEKAVLERFVQNRNFDIKVEAYLYGKPGLVSREEVIKEARKYKDVETYDRLMDRFRFEEAIKDLPEKSFWRRMKGLMTEAKARVFVDRLKSASEEEKDQLWREYVIISRAKGVISPEFRSEVERLMREER